MDELTAQVLLEHIEESGRHATKKMLANGEYVVVAPDGCYLWDKTDAKRWLKGSLQKALARKLKKEEQKAVASV